MLGIAEFAIAAAPPASTEAANPTRYPALKRLLDVESFTTSPAELIRISESIPKQQDQPVMEFLLDSHVRYDANHRLQGRHHQLYRIDQEAAIQGWGLVQSEWQTWLEERPLIKARVITPDGVQYDLDPTTIGEVQPSGENLELLSDRKMLRAPLPKLQVGSIVEIEIRTREHRSMATSGARANFSLAWNIPVLCSRILVESATNTPLKAIIHGQKNEILKREKRDGLQCLCIEQDLVMPIKEPEPLPDWDHAPWPSLTLTTASSWESVAKEYQEIVESQIRDSELESWVKEAIGDTTDKRAKIEKILAKLHKQVRYFGLEFGQTAIVPRSPKEVLARGYGDCKDKATLLVAALRTAGIPAHVTLLRAGFGLDYASEIPGLAAFNHAIVQVEGKTPIWVDPTVPQAKPGILPLQDCGRQALVISPETKAPQLIPAITAAENLQVETKDVYLLEDGLGTIKETLEGFGSCDVTIRSQFTGKDVTKLKENLKTYTKKTHGSDQLSEVELGDPLNLKQPFHLGMEIKKVTWISTTEAEARVTMNPWSLVSQLHQDLQPTQARGEQADTTSQELNPRKTDLLFPRPWAMETKWKIHYPIGYGPDVLPAPKRYDFGPAQLTMDWKTGGSNEVEARFHFECSQIHWTPQEVDSARKTLKSFSQETAPVLILPNLGQSCLKTGKWKEALEQFRRMLRQRPESESSYTGLAKAQLAVGLGGSARETLQEAAKRFPNSETVHRNLGWVLEHDLFGRRFAPGWDRAGAIQALRKAMELAPDLRMARLDLAILLSTDRNGEWMRGTDLEEAAQLYREQLKRGKDDRAQLNLARIMMVLDRFEEAKAAIDLADDTEEARGIRIAAFACLKGGKEGVREAKRSIQDLQTRNKAILAAFDLLLTLRHYPEAAAITPELAETSSESRDLQARIPYSRMIKRHESIPVNPQTPFGSVLAFAKASNDENLKPESLTHLLSPALGIEKGESKFEEINQDFLTIPLTHRQVREQRMDELFSIAMYGQDGSEDLGYRLQIQNPAKWPFPARIFVAKHEGTYRIVAWGYQAWRLGLEALWNLDHGKEEVACTWLDRAVEMFPPSRNTDPLSSEPFLQFWTKGKRGSSQEIRLAAAMLIAHKCKSPESNQVLEEALSKEQDRTHRGALIRELLREAVFQKEHPDKADALSRELLSLFPDSPWAVTDRLNVLHRAKQFNQAEELLSNARRKHPDETAYTSNYLTFLGNVGRSDERKTLLKLKIERGQGNSGDLNALAWQDVCAGTVSEESETWIERAISIDKSPGKLHTKACVLTELERFQEAHTTILARLSNKTVPNASDWYFLGRMAEHLEEPSQAKNCYQKAVQLSEEDSDSRISAVYLAKTRLESMDSAKGKPGVK